VIRSQPVNQKIRGMTEKYVLREAVRDVITGTVYRRQKHPFLNPPATPSPDETFHTYVQEKNKAVEEGRYRHRFDVPAAWKDRRVFLIFEGSMTDTEIAVNGPPAGPVHRGGFYEFRREITPLVRAGRSNLLEVAVREHSSNASVNRAERDGDFWVLGGIYRPVRLEAVPQACAGRVAIDARADGAFAAVVHIDGALPAARQITRKNTIETAVGSSAPSRRPAGAIAPPKYRESSACPAGFGALAMTVSPPPATAPWTTAILSESLRFGTRVAR